MTIGQYDVTKILKELEDALSNDKDISPSLRMLIKTLIMVVHLMAGRLHLNSRNSSKPPSSDPNREKNLKENGERKPGGQKGHIGKTLEKVDHPDKIEVLKVNRSKLPMGNYKEIGFMARQVFDIQISSVVTEYRAEILEDENGKQYVADFPEDVTKAVQYGAGTKAHAVYMSQYQLIPYDRIVEYFEEQIGIPISAGSLFNFNKQAYDRLAEFEELTKQKLREAMVAHADETGAVINGKKFWLHCFSDPRWTFLFIHAKRGTEAINEADVLPKFNGTLVHDHWKPYFTYPVTHALCNAHHLRELTFAFEEDGQQWAKNMHDLLLAINDAANNAGGVLNSNEQIKYRDRYRDILKNAETECPPPTEPEKKTRGKTKRSKSRNLLERFVAFENDILRFMTDPAVPFTNNQGERDLRMTKVQQKISGCFRSLEGAQIFCRLRSYLSTCRKQGINPSEALELLFKGVLPNFTD